MSTPANSGECDDSINIPVAHHFDKSGDYADSGGSLKMRRDPGSVQGFALVIVAAAAGWFLLQQLAGLLRPLLIAAFLAYVLMPYHNRLRSRLSGPVSIAILAGIAAALLIALALAAYASILGLSDELPQLESQAISLAHRADLWIAANTPEYARFSGDGRKAEEQLAGRAAQALRPIVNSFAEAILEAGIVGLYLVFLLLEATRFPDRIKFAYPHERAEQILGFARQVSSAIASYLRAKVLSSLLLSLPIGIVLVFFGIRFALLWVVLTFFCNFIPYIGTCVAYIFPVVFTFLQLDVSWQPITVAIVILAWHGVSASIIEPMLLGRAVGLSPLIILSSLAFWGLIWGIPGMFLAIPLTVTSVIVMDHFDLTRPLARLLRGE